MKNILYTLALLVSFSSFGQTLKELNDNPQKYDSLYLQYSNSRDYKSAIELAEKSLQTDIVKSDNIVRAVIFFNLGTLYGHLSIDNNVDLSIERYTHIKGSPELVKKSNMYFNKALTTKDCPAQVQTDCYIGLGKFNGSGDSEKALMYADLAIYVIEKHPDKSSIGNQSKGMAYLNRALAMYKLGYKSKKVCKYVKKADKFANDYQRAREMMYKLGCY